VKTPAIIEKIDENQLAVPRRATVGNGNRMLKAPKKMGE
jgi:hypothetical protein